MDPVMKKQSSMGSNNIQRRGTLAMHRDSIVISKIQPKIRIIHIFPPQIIHTDVANFRDVVEGLTGKNSRKGRVKGKGKRVIKQEQEQLEATEAMIRCDKPTVSPKLEVATMGTSGSSSSSLSSSTSDLYHQHYYHDHHDVHQYNYNYENTSYDGGYDNINLSPMELKVLDNDSFDFNSMFNLGEIDVDPSSHDLLNIFGETIY